MDAKLLKMNLQLFVTQTQTYSAAGNQLTAENAEYYERVMLERYLEEITFSKFGKKKSIPKNSGALISFRRLELLDTDPTNFTITEATTPDGQNVVINKVSATVAQYGAWSKVSDYLNLAGLDPVLTEIAEMFGEHAGRVNDNVVRDVVSAGTNVVYAAGRVSRVTVAAGDTITYADTLLIRETLRINKAPKIKLSDGTMGYLAFIHPTIASTLMQLTQWLDVNKFQTPGMIKDAVMGKLGGILFLETSECIIYTAGGAAGIDVYAMVVIGRNAFGIPDIGGSMSPEIIVKQPNGNDTDTSNPMNLYGTVAWKSLFVSLILNQAGIVRYEVAGA